MIDPGEACDDGNSEVRGWCSADCTEPVGPQRRLYATGGDGSVYVIDVQTQSVVATIPTGITPFETAVEASPDGRLVATLHQQSNSLILVDVASSSVAATVGLGTRDIDPEVLAFSPDSKKVYLSDGDVSLIVVDVPSRQVEREFSVDIFPNECPDGDSPWLINAVAVSPDGQTAYVLTLANKSHLLVVDLATDAARGKSQKKGHDQPSHGLSVTRGLASRALRAKLSQILVYEILAKHAPRPLTRSNRRRYSPPSPSLLCGLHGPSYRRSGVSERSSGGFFFDSSAPSRRRHIDRDLEAVSTRVRSMRLAAGVTARGWLP